MYNNDAQTWKTLDVLSPFFGFVDCGLARRSDGEKEVVVVKGSAEVTIFNLASQTWR